MPDALSKLSELQWRGKKYPVTDHRWLYRWEATPLQTPSAQFWENLGPVPWRFEYTIPLRNGIGTKRYGDQLFKSLTDLFKDCQNRERGPLIDPLWGEWQCICTEFSGSTDPTQRDGVDPHVVFVYKPSLDDPEHQWTGGLHSVAGLASDAGRLDQEVAKAFREVEEEPPEPTVDPLDAVSGLGAQISRQGDKITSALHNFARRCEKVENQLSKLKHPNTHELRRAVRRNRAAAEKLARESKNSLQTTKTVILRANKDALAVARDAGMTIQDLIRLNPAIAANPKIPQGTSLTVFAGKT